MFRVRLLTAIVCAALLAPVSARAGGITVTFRDTVKPDPELQAFVGKLAGLSTAGDIDYRAVDALFAPHVKAFNKSLDPFRPWHKNDDITADYLRVASDILVEQGDIEQGAKVPDYRPDALKIIVEETAKGEPFGKLREMPGAVCAPAAYQVDRKKAGKFAGKYALDAYSLRFFAQPVGLYKMQNFKGEFLGMIPPYTLMMFDYDPKAKEPWALYEASTGVKGYLWEDQPVLGLAQRHVCFGKVDGRYRIVALFGYGL